ncbi:MAG: hypothetical protein JNL54_15695 [Kineosporiaceae bacterium]|nr:hypothetical protein [Kineosporiaceae bacterium]
MRADPNDSDVLSRARFGDDRAFLALYRAAQPGLLRYLTVLVGDAAESIAELTWADVGRQLPDFDGTLEDFRGWVAVIGRGHALQHRAAVPQHPPVIAADGPTPPRTARALQVIAGLPREEAEAVALQSVMGLDEGGAATVLGVRRGAVRRAALRGLRALARRSEGTDRPREASPSAMVHTLRIPVDSAAERSNSRARVDLEAGQGIEVSR